MKCLVTGGGGFLGKALCLKLISEGNTVTSLSRGKYPELVDAGITCIQADITGSLHELKELFEEIEVVFHVAAKVDMWGRYDDFFSANVIGTRNVLAAARLAGVKAFVYTSSPSVVADGSDLKNVDESYPYPKKAEAYYPATKAIAEKEVLEEHQEHNDGFRTLSLRPHLIFGPGDTSLTRTILERAEKGKLVQIGAGENKVDFTFIDDCVQAHICAAKALLENPGAGGHAYFISQGEPMLFWEWVSEILKRNGLPPLSRKVPRALAMKIAFLMEWCVRLLPFNLKPQFTRFLVSELTTDHYFNIEKAKTLIGYKPQYSMREALDLTFAE